MTMRAVIGENTKSDIIKQWMSGKSRDAIALSSGVSAGVVSKVVANWKTAIDVHVADDLREMAVTLRKLELSPSECAIGARVYKIIKSMGLNEENELEFLSDTYKQTRELGIAPQAIADSLRELVDLTATVSVIEMPGYLMQKRHEKLELEDEILELKSQQVAAKKFAEDALNQHRVTVSELQNYSNFKKEMAHNEISIDDIAKFMNMVNVIKKTTDFHPAVVLSRFHTLSEIDIGKILLDQLKGEINQLNEEIKQLKDEKDAHIQSSKTYKELESLGMGLKELRFLRNTIREIASENGIPPSFAVTEFFSHIEEEYDRVLGFKSKLDKLKSEIQEERSKRAAFQSQLAGIDWASFFRSFQGEQLLQGPTKEQKTTNKMQITEDVAESRSNLGSDVNTASIEDTLPTSGEIKKSSPEQSKSENENEPSDEQVRLYQENLRKKYGSPM